MLGAFWKRLVGRRNADAADREVEAEQMSPAERDFAEKSVDDVQADATTQEHLGGIDPERLLGDDERPRG